MICKSIAEVRPESQEQLVRFGEVAAGDEGPEEVLEGGEREGTPVVDGAEGEEQRVLDVSGGGRGGGLVGKTVVEDLGVEGEGGAGQQSVVEQRADDVGLLGVVEGAVP